MIEKRLAALPFFPSFWILHPWSGSEGARAPELTKGQCWWGLGGPLGWNGAPPSFHMVFLSPGLFWLPWAFWPQSICNSWRKEVPAIWSEDCICRGSQGFKDRKMLPRPVQNSQEQSHQCRLPHSFPGSQPLARVGLPTTQTQSCLLFLPRGGRAAGVWQVNKTH